MLHSSEDKEKWLYYLRAASGDATLYGSPFEVFLQRIMQDGGSPSQHVSFVDHFYWKRLRRRHNFESLSVSRNFERYVSWNWLIHFRWQVDTTHALYAARRTHRNDNTQQIKYSSKLVEFPASSLWDDILLNSCEDLKEPLTTVSSKDKKKTMEIAKVFISLSLSLSLSLSFSLSLSPLSLSLSLFFSPSLSYRLPSSSSRCWCVPELFNTTST